MRNIKTFVKDVARKPPLIFSMLALFHVAAFLYTLWNVHKEPFPSIIWLQVLWMTAYTVCWVYTCDLRRWAALSYLVLTSVNIVVLVAVKSPDMRELTTNAIFPIDVLFCFFILFYYKKFE